MFMYVATLIVVLLSIFGFTQSWPTRAGMIENTGPLVPIFELTPSPFLMAPNFGKYPIPKGGNESVELIPEHYMHELQETYSDNADNDTTQITGIRSYIENLQVPSSSQISSNIRNIITGGKEKTNKKLLESVQRSIIEADSKQIVKELTNQHNIPITNPTKKSTNSVPIQTKNESKNVSLKKSGNVE
ncbi:hypothetical protein PV326_002822 [Microctonus aethiopoides]|uniref:Uncharacterized protein n=1 Tax=Microctonus aethiopoides TaxID=144406 RepID=A0AA39FAZ4_9HYME|nr:hypothetical protein PV326_002822 [Microctonus aethiopoides]KAK0166217.1 hypothetical protein PV328_004658 [Microctonus aethiopoides]